MGELGGARGVIVFSLGEPRQRLMGWFLKDSGICADLTDSLEQTLELAATRRARVLILNTTVPHAEINAAVEELRRCAPDMRIIVLHKGRHTPDEPAIPADICIHDVCDPDRLVETVKVALQDGLPIDEPHVAAHKLA